MRRRLAAVLVLVLAAAGCLGASSSAGPSSADAGPASVDEDPPAGAYPDLSGAVAFHLGGGWGLSTDRPTSGTPNRLDAGNFYGDWAQGKDQPTWTGPPLPRDVHVTGPANLTFWVEADPVVATTGPQDQGFPEYVVYFGTLESPVAFASVEGPDVKTAGTPVKIEATLPTPPGGLVLEEDARPAVILAPVQAHTDHATRLEFLVNSTTYDARVEVAAQPVDVPEPNRTTEERWTGTLAGSAYATSEGPTTATHPLQVDPSATRVDVQLGSQGVGVRDIDLALVGPDGEVVAQSVTPHPEEGVVLHEATLEEVGAGDWTVQVTNYGHAAVDYAVEASVGQG